MCFFIADYHGKDNDDSIMSEYISAMFKKLRLFVEEATKHELYHDIHGNDAVIDLARDLYYDSETITKYRFYLLTDAYNKQLVHEDIMLAAKAGNSSLKDEFLIYALGILANGEEFDDYTECHYDGINRRNGKMAIDGYSKDDTDL